MHFLFLALFVIAFILCICGEIMFIVAAFRVSVVWGLCVLFLGPAQFIFLIMHWEEAKKAFGVTMVGVLLGFAAIFSGMGSGGAGMEGLAETLASSGVAEEHLEALQKMAEENLDSGAEVKKKAKPVKTSKLFGKDPKSFEGATLAEVRDQLGRPKGEMKSGGEICLLYDRFSVFSADGDTVSHVEVGDGQVTGSAAAPRRRAKAPSTGGSRGSAVRMISNGGQRIDMKQVLVPGTITVVDFYADWCGPCKRMGPQLEQLARSDPDVALCKVDIVNWNTPVVKQFGIRSVPNIRVYDRNGGAVGNPTSGLGPVKQSIERAR